MREDRNQGPAGSKKSILIAIALLIAAAGIYYGYRQIMNRHALERGVLEQERKQLSKKVIALKEKVQEFQEEMAAQEAPSPPEERLAEVFGERPELSGQERCDALKRKIAAFFAYLDRQAYVKPYVGEGSSFDLYIQAIQDLSGALPTVIGETRDIVSLTRNSAHFFRALGKNRILFGKEILTHERDILEPTLANFYEFYTSGECCGKDNRGCPSPEALYEYAGFFLNTLSGKSYLMRRESVVRTLITCYSIFMLDRANDNNLNRYGIDIRPHIDFSIDDISNHRRLVFQKEYVGKLNALKEKYQQGHPARIP